MTDRVLVNSLEVSAVYHCNNRCVGCNHFSPVSDRYFLDADVLRRDLANLSRIIRARKFAFLGGEPLLHPDLIGLLGIARESGIADCVGVTTNGQLLHRMPDELWGMVDAMIIDVYPDKMSASDIEAIYDKAAKFGIALTVEYVSRFYKCLTREDSPADVTAKRFVQCPYKDVCYTIDQGYLYRCPQSVVIPQLLMGKSRADDGVLIDGLDYDTLIAFLKSERPLTSCRRCSNNEAWAEWREAGRANWLEESMA